MQRSYLRANRPADTPPASVPCPERAAQAGSSALDVSSPEDELEALRRIGRGDDQAWGSFYTRWNDRLQRSADRILDDADEANGAVTEAMIQIRMRSMRGDLPEASDVERWIYAKVRTCAMRLRGRRELIVEGLDQIAAYEHEEPDQEEGSAADVRLSLLRRAMGRLPHRNRRAVLLRFMGGHSFREIAEIEGCGVKGARGRVERGILQLVSALFAAKQAATPAQLNRAERAHVLDVAAKIRVKAPATAFPEMIQEVCRQTGIAIQSRACAVALLGPLPRRSR